MDLAEQNAALTLRIQDAWSEIERLQQIEAAATSFLDAVEETVPGFTAERIEGEMSRLQATLDAKPRRPTTHWYLSTACHHALMGDESLHARCRVACKFGGELCACPVCKHEPPEVGACGHPVDRNDPHMRHQHPCEARNWPESCAADACACKRVCSACCATCGPTEIVASYLLHAPEQGDWGPEDHADGLASGVVEALRTAGCLTGAKPACPHVSSTDEGTSHCTLAASASRPGPLLGYADAAGVRDHIDTLLARVDRWVESVEGTPAPWSLVGDMADFLRRVRVWAHSPGGNPDGWHYRYLIAAGGNTEQLWAIDPTGSENPYQRVVPCLIRASDLDEVDDEEATPDPSRKTP